ncbi:LutC/YkgG family protein [Alistipes putredinis]|uniref:LutC/YkgG family protein n=1 Tax=Alistipes putredinis TaxID=28117 RepID=UPI002666DF6F|nr:LUD domain-containing protein [Alistipes putredinis]
MIRRYYPDAKTIASVLPEAHATIDPDTVDDARKLIDIDLGIIDGCFGVAENGAVWIRQDIRHKALYFGATALMILIPRDALVDTMHEALARPELDDFEYGCFMSGPSKTADIEQALVFGAHGPMSITVVLR